MAKTDVGIVTEYRDGILFPVPLMAGALVLQGTFAVINTEGFAITSANVGGADQTCLGVWDNSAQNLGENGDAIACVYRHKHFLVRNSDTDPVTQADLGKMVYIEDNQTIAKTDNTGTRSLAGRFMGFDTQYENCVWVEI